MTSIISSLLLGLIAMGCQDIPHPETVYSKAFRIEVEIQPEGNNGYNIFWKDTLGQREGYRLTDRPFEVWCFIKDKSDTVGFYRGKSDPSDYTYFSTQDSLVTVYFQVGPNFFSEAYGKGGYKNEHEVVRFNPVHLNLRDSLRKPMVFVLSEWK